MEHADSLRKMKFVSAREGIAAFREGHAGKILLLAEGAEPLLRDVSVAPRTLTVIFDGDALPLFSIDGAGAIAAVGGERLMRTARYAAEVLRLPALLVPTSAALDGVFERVGKVRVDGVWCTVPLKDGEIVLDETLLSPSLGHAYARLLLSRLALFELGALSRLRREENGRAEEIYRVLLGAEGDGRGIVRANAALRLLEDEGGFAGEGSVLFRRLGSEQPEIEAYEILLAAYTAFFACGRPNCRAVDYRACARGAGVPFSALSIPSPEQLFALERAFLRAREDCGRELAALNGNKRAHMSAFRALGGKSPERHDLTEWKKLPERHAAGLTAVMRDFGLLEF